MKVFLQTDNAIELYRIRRYRLAFQETQGGPITVERLQSRLGPCHKQAHYDPGIGYTGLEWAFVDEKGEPFLLFIEYQTCYIGNARGGIQLRQFGEWLAGFLDTPPVSDPPYPPYVPDY